jgi:4'-phosphopantetheinyl transferase EntD
MDKELENLFPASLQQATIEHFGPQALGIILLKQQTTGNGPAPLLPGPAAELLHAKEKARAGAYRFSKRRSEFVTGRICAKLAVGEFLAAKHSLPAPALSTVEIGNTSTGRPFVNFIASAGSGNRPQPEISITHGGAYGAAMATDDPCGIDLQEQKDTLLRVMDKYCTAGERGTLQTSLPEMEQLARLSLLWAAKEAAKKTLSYWRMPGFLDLELTLPVLRPAGCFAFNFLVRQQRLPGKITVLTTPFFQYGLAVCILKEARSHAGIT